MKKRCLFGALLLAASLSLSACGYSTVQEMYRFPKRTQEYTALQSTIEQAMSDMEFASPVTGENQQTVQTADLDGDGRQEYLVFARENSEKPLKILIFHETEDEQYYLMETLHMNGSAFEAVEYADMDGRPGKELVIGRRLSNQVMRIAAVYSFADGQSDQLINTIYTKFLTTDLDEDGIQELVVIREGDTDVSAGSSVIYTLQGESMERLAAGRFCHLADARPPRRKVFGHGAGHALVGLAHALGHDAVVRAEHEDGPAVKGELRRAGQGGGVFQQGFQCAQPAQRLGQAGPVGVCGRAGGLAGRGDGGEKLFQFRFGHGVCSFWCSIAAASTNRRGRGVPAQYRCGKPA